MKLKKEDYHSFWKSIKECDSVLLGVGEELACETFYPPEKNPKEEWEKAYVAYQEMQKEKTELKEAYQTIHRWIDEKDYFFVTSTVDGFLFQQDFDKEKIVAPCGNIQHMQCEEFSHNLWSAKEAFLSKEEQALFCPICGRRGRLNIWTNKPYQEAGYQEAWKRYMEWLSKTLHKKLLILEFGEGLLTPTVMRWPFEKIAYFQENSIFMRVHKTLSQIPQELSERAYAVSEHSIDFLRDEKWKNIE